MAQRFGGINFHTLMEERVRLVEQGCQSRRRSIGVGIVEDLFPLPLRSMVWCPVYKVE